MAHASSPHGPSGPPPGDEHGTEDATLGGYVRVHERSPAFEGRDGHPYTVSMEVEKVARLDLPYAGYLVFPRWARTGVGIVGHAETHLLVHARSEAEALRTLSELPLLDVKRLLDEAIGARSPRADHPPSDDA